MVVSVSVSVYACHVMGAVVFPNENTGTFFDKLFSPRECTTFFDTFEPSPPHANTII